MTAYVEGTVADAADEGEHPHHAKTDQRDYLLVCDLPQRIHAFTLAGLKVPEVSDPFFSSLEEEMRECLESVLPESINLRIINMQELGEDILTKARGVESTLEHGQGFVVSTCTEISQMAHGGSLEVNRLVDIKGEVLGIGPRPGHPDIDSQVRSLVSAAAGRSIVLVEDGTFTGGTIVDLLERFQKNHADVAGVVLGFAFPGSLEKLKTGIDIEKVHMVEEVNNPIDWMPDHDFFPFVPNCGRVVGVSLNGSVYPFYNHMGVSYSIPYLSSYCPMREWTGIDTSNRALCMVSDFFLRKTVELFSIMEELNDGRQLMFKDICATKPACTMPCGVDQSSFYQQSDCRVVDYLRDVRQEIW
jgi:hypothetical protein